VKILNPTTTLAHAGAASSTATRERLEAPRRLCRICASSAGRWDTDRGHRDSVQTTCEACFGDDEDDDDVEGILVAMDASDAVVILCELYLSKRLHDAVKAGNRLEGAHEKLETGIIIAF
jgi:hypothetical protein